MNRTECERLVERYLGGKMDFAEEHDFFIQVAVDNELRRTLKSYQILESSIRKERDANVQAHSEARMRVASMVSRRLVEESSRGTAAAMMQESGSTGATTGTSLMRWIVTGIAAMGIGVGVLLMSDSGVGSHGGATLGNASATTPRVEPTIEAPHRDVEPSAQSATTELRPVAQERESTPASEPVTVGPTPTQSVREEDGTTSGVRIVERSSATSNERSQGTPDSILRSTSVRDTIHLPFMIDGNLPK
jgi:hypothetical protein